MATEDRSFSEAVQSIVGNVQEMVRSEVRLAKAEIGEEATKAKSSAALLGAGAVTALFAMLFLLLTVFYALSLAMPLWTAALIVAALLGVIALFTIGAGRKQLKRIHPTPERTIDSIRENVEWAKQQAK